MLPRPLSEDLTSLLPDVDRLSVVIAYRVRPDGSVDEGARPPGTGPQQGQAQLPGGRPVAPGRGRGAAAVAQVEGLEEQLRLQDGATRALRAARERAGALALRTIEPRPVMSDGKVLDLEAIPDSRSRELIEDLMVAANGVMARFLDGARRSSLARIVRKPKRWDRIVALAQGLGTALPAEPDGVALSRSSSGRRRATRCTSPTCRSRW